MTDGQPSTVPASRIPEFTSIEEEAEWWDTHDITDYLDELSPVAMTFAPKFHPVYRFTVRLRMEDWEALERLADEREAQPEELAAEWLTERVRQAARARVASRQ